MMVKGRIRVPESVLGVSAVLRVLPRLGRFRAILFLGGVVLVAAIPVAAALVTGLLVGSIPAAVEHGLDSAAGGYTTRLLIVAGVLILVERGLNPVLEATGNTLGREFDRYLQERVLEGVGAPSGIAHLEDEEVLNEVRVARGLGMDAVMRPGRAIEAFPQVVPSWLTALGSVAVLFAFHWWLALLWLVAWPLIVFLMQREYTRIGSVTYNRSSALRRSEYYRDLAITAQPAKEIRIWGLLGWLVDRFDAAWYAAMEPVWRARSLRWTVVFGTTGTIALVNLLTFGLLAWAAIRGELGLAALAVFVRAMSGVNEFRAFDDNNVYLSTAAITVPKVLRMAERLGTERAPVTATPRELPADTPRDGVRFEGTSFGYPGAERPVFAGLDLEIPAHRSLAIVGANGAGKTSLVKLLCRLYEPTGGSISVDGTPLASLDPVAWRDKVAVLFQDFARYHLPARDNIALGVPEAAADTERIERAAERAGALELVRALPEGWDTVLSREYAGGTDLSGGQWQRIALARAMFAVESGAKLLILDEPTAALDVRAEAELYERFLDLTEGLTTILISHRFSTVRRADRIVVLADGSVAEEGSHEELLEQNRRYAEMFTLQARRFTTGAMTGGAADA